MLVPGTHPGTWESTRKLAAEHGVDLALGAHPWFLDEQARAPTPEELEGCVALGEIGLDKAHAKAHGGWERQRRLFREQLELAATLELPVVLHCVKAHGPMLAELERVGGARGTLHSFMGPAELVGRYTRLGLSFGFSPAVMRPGVRRALEAIRLVPEDRLRLESDAPDGGRPSDLPRLAAFIEALRGS
jgi:TatD DNase family protein